MQVLGYTSRYIKNDKNRGTYDTGFSSYTKFLDAYPFSLANYLLLVFIAANYTHCSVPVTCLFTCRRCMDDGF
jgi:hypothetical protein